MQEDDVIGLGDLVGRAVGIALISDRKVLLAPRVVRCGTQDYLRRCYFRKNELEMEGEFAGGSFGATWEGKFFHSMERGREQDEMITAGVSFDRGGRDVDFAMLLDSCMQRN